MARPHILSVGQCGYDHGNIKRVLGSAFQADVWPAATTSAALEALRKEPYDLVLINRVFAGDGSSGLELVRAIKSDPELSAVPVMLVSNYPDAQEEAVALGALPGFGKGELHSPECVGRIGEAIGAASSS